MSPNDAYKRWHKPTKNLYNIDGKLKKGQTYQGYLHEEYKLKFPEKYIGDLRLIIYRSNLELAFCKWCDSSPSIIKWSSEPTKVPYYDRVSKLEEYKKYNLNPNDSKNWVIRNYNLDFYIEIKKPDDTIEKWYVEVKPSEKLHKPIPPPISASLKEQRQFNVKAKEYLINEAKFVAAKAFAEKKNAKFFIFTEETIRRITGNRFIY